MVPAPGAEPSAERGAVQDVKPGPGPAVAVKAIAGPIQGTAEGAEDQGELACSGCAGLDHIEPHRGLTKMDRAICLKRPCDWVQCLPFSSKRD